MPVRNILLLTACQLISATGSIVIVTLGGIIGATLSENPALATLPISIMVVSVASTTILATMLMRAIGRRRSFMLASLSATAAVLLATYALAAGSFTWFILSAALFGVNLAFTQQYRYAAAESVEPAYAARAISFVLLGAIGGAVIGPELVRVGEHFVTGIQYAGTLASLAVLYLLQAVLFLFLSPTSATASLLAGTVMHLYGWYTLVLMPLPLLLLILIGLYSVRRDARLRRLSPARG